MTVSTRPRRAPWPTRALGLFCRNTVAGTLAFAVDLMLLWLLVEQGGLAYLPAAAFAFLVALTLHYALARAFVFPASTRGVASGYALFLMNAGIGMLVMLAAFWALTEATALNYLVARLLSSVNSGVVMFLLNAVYNFRAL